MACRSWPRVDVGAVAADHAGLPQGAHPRQAGGLGDAHALGQVLVGDTRVVDEGAQQRAIGRVEANFLRRKGRDGPDARRR